MNFFQIKCRHQEPCNCLNDYLEHLLSLRVATCLEVAEKERFSNRRIKEEAPRNNLGLRVYNTMNRNTATALKAIGRPAGTHDTVIGENEIGRRWDFQRRTREAA